MDGFNDSGIGNPYRRPRPIGGEQINPPITVVHRAEDMVLQEAIGMVRESIGGLPPWQRAAALRDYVEGALTPDHISRRAFNEWGWSLTRGEFSGKQLRVPLGQLILEGKGTAGQKALLMKVLADELNLKATLSYGPKIEKMATTVWLPGGALRYEPTNFARGLIYYPHLDAILSSGSNGLTEVGVLMGSIR